MNMLNLEHITLCGTVQHNPLLVLIRNFNSGTFSVMSNCSVKSPKQLQTHNRRWVTRLSLGFILSVWSSCPASLALLCSTYTSILPYWGNKHCAALQHFTIMTMYTGCNWWNLLQSFTTEINLLPLFLLMVTLYSITAVSNNVSLYSSLDSRIKYWKYVCSTYISFCIWFAIASYPGSFSWRSVEEMSLDTRLSLPKDDCAY